MRGNTYAKQSNKKVTIAFVLVLSAIVIIILCGSQLVFQKACIRKKIDRGQIWERQIKSSLNFSQMLIK